MSMNEREGVQDVGESMSLRKRHGVAEVKMLRFSLGVMRVDRIRNE